MRGSDPLPDMCIVPKTALPFKARSVPSRDTIQRPHGMSEWKEWTKRLGGWLGQKNQHDLTPTDSPAEGLLRRVAAFRVKGADDSS